MAHSFLVEPGGWRIEGRWNRRDGQSIPFQGKTLISWSEDDWFAWVTKLVFEADPPELYSVTPEPAKGQLAKKQPANSQHPELIFRYRGNFDRQTQRYTFVLEHSRFGRSEGEGWLTSNSILQRYWALKDTQRRNCFDTLYQIDRQSYHWSSATLSGPRLTTALDATLTRAQA